MWEMLHKWKRKIVEHPERKRRRDRNMIRYKVGASYSVWDGEELLEYAIQSIRSEVDYVNVVWQRLSWYGVPCDSGLEAHLNSLKNKGLIDELLFFEPDLSASPGVNETNKRNIGLVAAQQAGCSYFLTLDVDEFFEKKAFRRALDYVMNRGITHSACNQIGYVGVNCRQSLPPDWFAPFAYRIDHGEKFVLNAFGELPWLIDPSKKIPITYRSRICFLGQVILHHYSGIRKNMCRKVENSSANPHGKLIKTYTENVQSDLCSTQAIESGECIQVPNYFGIHL